MKSLTKKQRKVLGRIITAAVMLLVLVLVDSRLDPWYIKLLLYLVPYLIVGYDIILKAAHGILHGQVFDENFLMVVATAGALGVSIYDTMHGESGSYIEAVSVMLLYQVGELFQSIAVGRSRRSISELMDIRPDTANIEEDGELVQVDPDDVEIGSVIIVRPGEKIPIDGTVIEGSSSLNTSALTGESLPRSVEPGSQVLSGCVNLSGVLKIETTAEFGESTASKVLDLVENAASKKSRSENFISKFAKYYTPIVCIAALALAIIPPVILALTGSDPALMSWVYRACTFLVISCPCALVISIPLTFFAGLGGASSEGVLIKGSSYLETLAQVRTVVFDKTGTITQGNFEVTGVHHSPLSDHELLRLAAHVESSSSHPISASLRKAYGLPIDRDLIRDIQEISGEGVIGKVDGHEVAAGNLRLMRRIGIEAKPCSHPGTIVYVAVDGEYCGHIVISDQIKPSSVKAIRDLHNAGVKRTVMLTGDTAQTAEAVAKEAGIDEFRAGLLPADKVTEVEKLMESSLGRDRLAFVGDGINDAPVLARADVGIAMGALGSDAAIEAADVVLMDDDPVKIAKGIRISRKCLRIARENIVFSLCVKAVCLVLGALGIASMWLAVLADVGVMIICVLNAIRALYDNKLI